jgi:hypothetical protein
MNCEGDGQAALFMTPFQIGGPLGFMGAPFAAPPPPPSVEPTDIIANNIVRHFITPGGPLTR